MSPVYLDTAERTEYAEPLVRRVDDKRGTWGMSLFILTEAFLFIIMFFAYFYVEKGNERWQVEVPPKLHYALPQLAILLISSGLLYWGEEQVKKERFHVGRLALIGTILLAILFLGLSYLSYSEHLLHLTPRTDSYGSIFYTIVTLHIAHLVLGTLMMLWLLFLTPWGPRYKTPHRPYHNVSLYWHFVDLVWIFVVAILFVAPNVYNA